MTSERRGAKMEGEQARERESEREGRKLRRENFRQEYQQ